MFSWWSLGDHQTGIPPSNRYIPTNLEIRVPFQYPIIRLIVRSREVSKPRDWLFELSHRLEIWQTNQQHCCRGACQISERSHDCKYKSCSFETLRDLTIKRLIGYWNRAEVPTDYTYGYLILNRSDLKGWDGISVIVKVASTISVVR